MIEIKNFKKNNILLGNKYISDVYEKGEINSFINLVVKQSINNGELDNSVTTNLAAIFVKIYYLVKLKFSDIIKRAD